MAIKENIKYENVFARLLLFFGFISMKMVLLLLLCTPWPPGGGIIQNYKKKLDAHGAGHLSKMQLAIISCVLCRG